LEDTTIEDVLKTIETLYAQKDYQKALKTLESNQGKISPGLWHYNMGTIYGKLENWPQARFHFLMAEKEGLHTKEVILNRTISEEKLEVIRLEKPLSTKDYFYKAGLEASSGIFTTVSLIFLLIGLAIFWKKSSIKALGLFLVLSFGITGLSWWVQSWHRALVVEPQSLHDGPSAIFGAREEIPTGVLLITRQKGDWLEVMYPSRFQGWIKNVGLKELK
jgi:hypothetical protein